MQSKINVSKIFLYVAICILNNILVFFHIKQHCQNVSHIPIYFCKLSLSQSDLNAPDKMSSNGLGFESSCVNNVCFPSQVRAGIKDPKLNSFHFYSFVIYADFFIFYVDFFYNLIADLVSYILYSMLNLIYVLYKRTYVSDLKCVCPCRKITRISHCSR